MCRIELSWQENASTYHHQVLLKNPPCNILDDDKSRRSAPCWQNQTVHTLFVFVSFELIQNQNIARFYSKNLNFLPFLLGRVDRRMQAHIIIKCSLKIHHVISLMTTKVNDQRHTGKIRQSKHCLFLSFLSLFRIGILQGFAARIWISFPYYWVGLTGKCKHIS